MSQPVLRCTIVIEADSDGKPHVTINWEPSLPEGPHEVSWVELMAASAVFGISQAKSGKGKAATLRILQEFERARTKGREPA